MKEEEIDRPPHQNSVGLLDEQLEGLIAWAAVFAATQMPLIGQALYELRSRREYDAAETGPLEIVPVSAGDAEINSTIGERLRTARTRAQLSQRALHDATGLATSFICDVERGKRGISAANLIRLAQALSVAPGWLLTGDAPPPPAPAGKERDER